MGEKTFVIGLSIVYVTNKAVELSLFRDSLPNADYLTWSMLGKIHSDMSTEP